MILEGLDVGILVRVSSDGQVKDESPEVHLKRGHGWADSRKANVVAVYQLDAVSGGTVMHHPDIQRMMRDAESGRIKGLIFSAVARIGRNFYELIEIEKHLRENRCLIISTRRGVIDTSTPEGMWMYINEAYQAQAERQELSRRIIAGLLTRAQSGQITAGNIPYGYRKVKRQLEIHPEEGPVRARMYAIYLKHQRVMEVARQLNNDGYRTRRGVRFTHVSVKATLLESSAKGVYIANRTGARGVRKPPEDWIEIAVPPLVSIEDWERCRALLEANHIPHRRTIYPYSGLLHCHCGAVMYVRAQLSKGIQPRYQCRACGSRISLAALDAHVGELFAGFLLEGGQASAQAEISQAEKELMILQTRLTTLTKSLKRILEAYKVEALSLEEFKAEREPLALQKRETEAALARLQAELRSTEEQQQDQAKAVRTLQEAVWAELEPGEKAEILQKFLQAIVLTPEHIRAQVLYTPDVVRPAETATADGTLKSNFPFARVFTLSRKLNDSTDIPPDSRAWGYYLKLIRQAQALTTQAVAVQLNISVRTLTYWELLNGAPSAHYIPAIIRFLGFVPWPCTPYQPTLPEAIRNAREIKGWNQGDLARQMGVTQAIVSRIELGKRAAKWKIERMESLLNTTFQRYLAALILVTLCALGNRHIFAQGFGAMMPA